jgi:hypothetical protein
MSEREYEDLLNKTYSPVSIFGHEIPCGTALFKADYIAFRKMFKDWLMVHDKEEAIIPKKGDKVKLSWGRNAGQWGKVSSVSDDGNTFTVRFGSILVDGEVIPDFYSSNLDGIAEIDPL